MQTWITPELVTLDIRMTEVDCNVGDDGFGSGTGPGGCS
jgi:hypothetical protein